AYSMAAPNTAAGTWAHTTARQRQARNPPSITKATKAACTSTTQSARARYTIFTPPYKTKAPARPGRAGASPRAPSGAHQMLTRVELVIDRGLDPSGQIEQIGDRLLLGDREGAAIRVNQLDGVRRGGLAAPDARVGHAVHG